MPKKLLYVLDHIDHFWSHRLPVALAAQDAGYEIYIAAAGTEGAKTRLQQYNLTGLPLDQARETPSLMDQVKVLKSYIKDNDIDLVHSITLKYAFITGLAARGQNIDQIHTIAGLGYLFRGDGIKSKILRALVGPVLKYAIKTPRTRLIFQNPDDMELMIDQGFVTRDKAVLIRGSGVDTQHYNFSPAPDNDVPYIVFPTRLIWEKGIKPFIEMAKIVEAKGFKARYAIAGGISTTNPNAVKESEIAPLLRDSPVRWLGHVSDMPGLLAQSDIVVYPSWYGEGIPRVLLEAAAIGRPIITTDHAGCREAVDEGENGFLVPARDAEAIAEAVITLLNDRDLRETMGRNSRKKAEHEFDLRDIVMQTAALY